MIPEQTATVGFSTRPYKVSIKASYLSGYSLTLDLAVDGRDMVDHSQVATIIELVKVLKGWSNPDIMTDDEAREIELEY